jgi:carotenoid cleavage dioxygenase
VVIDVVRHPRMFDTVRDGPDEGPSTLWRWTLDLTSGAATETQLDDRALEFPRVDERVVGRPHRFGWAVGLSATNERLGFDDSRVLRYDLQTGDVLERQFGRGHAVGEAVFVPSSVDAPEDDGWVLTLVADPDRGASDLWVLHAGDPAGDPVAVVHLPARVPLGFHGNWVPTAS